MNRERKYRAWHIEEKRMFDVFTFELDSNRVSEDGVSFLKVGSEVELMDYVGLKDKNGKKIFVDDVVSNGNVLARVDYNPCSFSLYPMDTAGYEVCREVDAMNYEFNYVSGVNIKTGTLDWLEVVGNIWEDPELVSSN